MDKNYQKRLARGTREYQDTLAIKISKRAKRIANRILTQTLVEGVQYRQSITGIMRPIKPSKGANNEHRNRTTKADKA